MPSHAPSLPSFLKPKPYTLVGGRVQLRTKQVETVYVHVLTAHSPDHAVEQLALYWPECRGWVAFEGIQHSAHGKRALQLVNGTMSVPQDIVDAQVTAVAHTVDSRTGVEPSSVALCVSGAMTLAIVRDAEARHAQAESPRRPCPR
jgi:hypothetical protein